MPLDIRTISLPMPLRMGRVNCHLVKDGGVRVLIDTGGRNSRRELEEALVEASCGPGNLRLIVITHGDFDHIGNAAYLRAKYGAKIAMHEDDVGMAERGDMFWNREKGGVLIRALLRAFVRLPKGDRFAPDVLLEDGTRLSEYGLDARVLSLPGHSMGSVGVLTDGGDLFCGDLLESTKKPALNAIMDDLAVARASVERLKGLAIRTVHPGHGAPFPMGAIP